MARDGDALALATGEFHPALADHRVVFLLELFDELFAMRDAAHSLNLGARGVRVREADVVGNRPVEKKVVLHDDAEVRPEVA